MRIGIDAHTAGTRRTGNETYVVNLIKALGQIDRGGDEFVFYHTMPFDTSSWCGEAKRIRGKNPFLRLLGTLPRAMKRDALDAAHFQYMAPPRPPCAVVNTIHDLSFEFMPQWFSPLERWRMKLLVPSMARSAARLITISNFSKEAIVRRYGIDPGKITVTHLAAGDLFRHEESSAALAAAKEKYNLPERYLLAVGNLQPRKNLERLINAFARLRRERKVPHELVLVGQPLYKSSRLARRIAGLGIENVVRATGYVPESDLASLYRLAEIFVYPSLYEGFGLPVLEAMTCGTPVISSNTASLPEVAGDAAVLVDPLSERELSEAIERLAGDGGLREQLRTLGLKRAEDFSWKKAARRTLDVYRAAAS